MNDSPQEVPKEAIERWAPRDHSASDCPNPNDLAAWIEGVRSEPLSTAIEGHLSRCEGCREMVHSITEDLNTTPANRIPVAGTRFALMAIAAMGLVALTIWLFLRGDDSFGLEQQLAQLPDEKSRMSYARVADLATAMASFEGDLGVDRSTGEHWLVEPRATITDQSPRFIFDVPAADPEDRQVFDYRVVVRNLGGGPKSQIVVSHRPQDPPRLEATLDVDDKLQVGGFYRWHVEIDPDRHPEYAGVFKADPVEFRLVSPASKARLIETIEPDHDLAPLLRATAYLSHDLALDALNELASLSATNLEKDQALFAELLRLEAYVLLRRDFDADRIQELRARATNSSPR